MRIFPVISLVMAVMILSSNPASAYVFESQVSEREIVVYIGSESGNESFNMAMLDTYNNYLLTINETQAENETLSGIVQYPVTIPSPFAYTVEPATSSGLVNRTLSLSWQFVPSEKILFDSSVDTWFRLPIHNITIGNGTNQTHTIEVRIEKVLAEEFTLSSSFTLSDCDYSTVLSQTITNVETNYYYNEERNVNWLSENQTGVFSHNYNYNFTWIRANVPLYKENLYVIVVNLTTMIDSDYPFLVEPLFTESDFNQDETFISWMGCPDVAGQEFLEIDCDFDTPMIFHELGTGAFHSIGFEDYAGTCEDYFIRSSYTLDTPQTVNNTYGNNYSYMIPCYARQNITVYSYMFFYFTSGGYYVTNSGVHVLNPGNNMIVKTGLINEFNGTPTPSTTVYRVDLFIAFEDNNITKLAVWLQNPMYLQGENVGFTLAYNATDYPNTYKYYSSSTMMAYYNIGTSLAYVPYDSIITVPDPLDYNSTIAWLELGERALDDQQFWAKVYDTGGAVLGVITIVPRLIGTAIAKALLWLGENLYNWIANSPGIGNALSVVGSFFFEVINVVYNALQWILTNGVHLVAVMLIVAIYIMTMILGLTLLNGYADAISKRKKKTLYDQDVLDRWTKEGSRQFHYLFLSVMGLIGFIWGAITVVGKLITGGLF
jgi:hypothetical protein